MKAGDMSGRGSVWAAGEGSEGGIASLSGQLYQSLTPCRGCRELCIPDHTSSLPDSRRGDASLVGQMEKLKYREVKQIT